MSAYWKRRALALFLLVFLLAGCSGTAVPPQVAPIESSQDAEIYKEHLASISKKFFDFKASMLSKIAFVDRRAEVFGEEVRRQWLGEKEAAGKLIQKGDGLIKEAEVKLQSGLVSNQEISRYISLISILMDQNAFEKVEKRYRVLGGN